MDWVHWPQGALIEHNAYFQFITRAGNLLPEHVDAWTVAFAMQHHGMPTRLLDWSDTFAVALHFAVSVGKGDAAVWLLNPFVLNKTTIGQSGIFYPTDLDGDYADFFVHRTKKLDGGVAAILPLRHHPRVFNQRGAFTVHGDVSNTLETLCPQALKKIVIPAAERGEAKRFLEMAGVSEFSLFPDLDGLARELAQSQFGKK
jgi:hypothetical protein